MAAWRCIATGKLKLNMAFSRGLPSLQTSAELIAARASAWAHASFDLVCFSHAPVSLLRVQFSL
jgi:hypothetical protein